MKDRIKELEKEIKLAKELIQLYEKLNELKKPIEYVPIYPYNPPPMWVDGTGTGNPMPENVYFT